MDFSALQDNMSSLISEWMPARPERMRRKALERSDFEALSDAGLTLTGVPAEMGGLWKDVEQSALLTATLLRRLATVDPSLALVASMHPTVLLFWLTEPAGDVPKGWRQHREMVMDQARQGRWFGTISSEPGIGGDIMATRAVAKPGVESQWLMTGDKFMGSGSGMTTFMMTVAVPEGEDRPDIFLLDMGKLKWDGSQGLKMVRPWDGLGMAATQSHAFRFDDVAVERHGLLGGGLDLMPQIGPVIGFMFSAVFVGILDAAALEAHRILVKRGNKLSDFERTSWVQAQNQIWLAQRTFEAMARSLGTESSGIDVLHGKLAIADLAEAALHGLSHAIGGASLSEASPFGQWMQDARALGYLRPPRALSYSRIFESLITP